MSWSWALDSYGTPNQPDSRIQQATTNILNAFLSSKAPLHDLKLVTPASVTAGRPFSVSVTADSKNYIRRIDIAPMAAAAPAKP